MSCCGVVRRWVWWLFVGACCLFRVQVPAHVPRRGQVLVYAAAWLVVCRCDTLAFGPFRQQVCEGLCWLLSNWQRQSETLLGLYLSGRPTCLMTHTARAHTVTAGQKADSSLWKQLQWRKPLLFVWYRGTHGPLQQCRSICPSDSSSAKVGRHSTQDPNPMCRAAAAGRNRQEQMARA